MKSGDRGKGQWSHCVWCEAHGAYHGSLYVCDTYPSDVKERISAASDRFKQNLDDPTWIKEQMANGIPEEAIAIFRLMRG